MTAIVRSLMYETESHYAHDRLDLDYIDAVAQDLAVTFLDHAVGEVCYQPGDATRYNLVFVPLASLVPASPRVVDGEQWEHRCITGLGKPYPPTGVLIARHEVTAWATDLAWAESLVATYVGEKLCDSNAMSGHSCALLIRTVAHYVLRPDAPRLTVLDGNGHPDADRPPGTTGSWGEA